MSLIKANTNKVVHITFTICKNNCSPIVFNGEILPEKIEVKYCYAWTLLEGGDLSRKEKKDREGSREIYLLR